MQDFLPVPQRVALGRQDIVFDVHPESHEQVNDNGRAHGKKGNVNKIFAYSGRGNAHFFTQIGANAKNMPFHKLPETLHNC